jgi:hypothetical protein
MNEFHHWLPTGYYLDLSEPDLHILKRPDGSMVYTFFPEAATRATLQQTAVADYREQNGRSKDPEHGVHLLLPARN